MMEQTKNLFNGMENYSKRIQQMEMFYLQLLDLAEKDDSKSKIFRIKEPELFYKVISLFGPALDNKNAGYDLSTIYEAGIHKETGALFISNKGATLYSLSPRTQTPHLIRHLGLSVYFPGLGIEFVNVGLMGDVYTSKVVLRSESACTPSFLFGSQRCNCSYQWDSIREVAAHFNKITPPPLTNGHDFENWVQSQLNYEHGKHLFKKNGPGFILMHIDTQNGMGSGYTKNEFTFDLYNRASMRHRGEYSSEQIHKTTMYGGFGAIGIQADPRAAEDHAGYKLTFMVLDYLETSRDIIFLTNNPLKMHQLKNNGYNLTRVKTIGAVNPAGAQEAEQRGSEFGHLDINGQLVTFTEELNRLKSEINELVENDN